MFSNWRLPLSEISPELLSALKPPSKPTVKQAASIPLPAAPKKKPAAGKKLRPITGMVVRCIQETYDTWTLDIFVGVGNKAYIAGQFISIDPHQFPELSELTAFLEDKKGKKEPIRAYSLCSAPHEPTISTTIKPERYEPGESQYPPLLSPLLASDALQGREIEFSGYSGAYILAPDHAEHTNEVLHLVAGSGAVPNFALLKDELLNEKNPTVFHTLIDVNRTHDDIIYRQELDQLARDYPHRFKLIHMITREDNPSRYGSNFLKGRPTFDIVKQHVKDPSKVLVYACGAAVTKWQKKKAKETGIEPAPRFMEGVREIVKELGVDRKRFKHEVYG